jgi:hypothetical protein
VTHMVVNVAVDALNTVKSQSQNQGG